MSAILERHLRIGLGQWPARTVHGSTSSPAKLGRCLKHRRPHSSPAEAVALLTGVRSVEGARELAGIDGVTVLQLDVAQPGSIASWADAVKAAVSHVDVSTPIAVALSMLQCRWYPRT